MEILDSKKNLLGYLIKKDKISSGKNFLTSNNAEFQIATFSLNKNEIIKRHIHNKYERKIFSTSEAITVIEGVLEIDIYDLNREYLITYELNAGDSIILIAGGHGLKTNLNTKFVEVKQGPYDQEKDKEHF
jgi:quercetin dioxygenase-like cupin family protein